MRRFALLVAAILLFAIAAPAPGEEPSPEQPSAHVTRIGKKVYNPRRHVKIVRRFNPTATPTPGYVIGTIIPAEAARWNVNYFRLKGRISCETGGTFRYWAHNKSGASGLGQFMPSTWARALNYWSQKVELVRNTTALVHRKVVIAYSDGSHRVVKGRLVRRHVTIVRRGYLPRWPSVYHGWASVRGVARALAGIGAVRASEWSCS